MSVESGVAFAGGAPAVPVISLSVTTKQFGGEEFLSPEVLD